MFCFVREAQKESFLFGRRIFSTTAAYQNAGVNIKLKNLTSAPKSRSKSQARRPQLSRKLRAEFGKHKNDVPVIDCKRIEFNFYEGMRYEKFEPVPLASQAWVHRGSNGDYFTLYKDSKYKHDNMHFGNIPILKPGYEYEHVMIGREEREGDASTNKSDFEKLGIKEELCQALRRMGLERAADIQVAAIPHVLEGKNCVISAHTGCGKTLAYLLPLIQSVLQRKKLESSLGVEVEDNCPTAMIITPSRELSYQIHDVLQNLTQNLPVKSKLIVGGTTTRDLARRTRQNVDIIVCSLGTISKHFGAGLYQSKRLSHVVLDEADQLLDDLNTVVLQKILRHSMIRSHPPRDKNNLDAGSQLTLVSATIPTNMRRIFEDIVNVETLERISTVHLHEVLKSVPQTFMKVGKTNKGKALLDLVEKDYKKGNPVLIFSNKSVTTDWVSLQLQDCGIPCRNLTSKVPYEIRKHTFQEFQIGAFNILSVTSMGARGLDTVRVEHVINFEFPLYMSDYIHRIGRVGRIGSSESCHVTNIVSHPREIQIVQQIELAVRTGGALENVNENIPGILAHRREQRGESLKERRGKK